MEINALLQAPLLVIICICVVRGNGTSKYVACRPRLSEKTILTSRAINLPNSEKCTTLDMRFGAIQEIDSDAFARFDNVHRLDLLCNSIHTISANAFKGTQIQRLDLSSNNVQCIPNLFDIRYTLEALIMSDNNLGNCSAAVTYAPLTKFDELQQIFIDEASLRNLPGIVLIAPNLKDLSLKNNLLKRLPNLMNLLPAISTLYLYGNRMICDCQLLWLHELENKLGIPQQFECETSGKMADRTKLVDSRFICRNSGKIPVYLYKIHC